MTLTTRRTQEEVDAASIREGVGGPGAGAECSLVRRAVGVDAVDGARGDARQARAVGGGRWVPRSLAHRAVHTVLKTGLHVEAQSVKDVSSARRLLSVLLPVSLHLMRWAYGWRETPQELASARVPDAVVSALKTACRYHQLPLPRRCVDGQRRRASPGSSRGLRTPSRSNAGVARAGAGGGELLRFWRIAHFVENAAPHELPGKPPPDHGNQGVVRCVPNGAILGGEGARKRGRGGSAAEHHVLDDRKR